MFVIIMYAIVVYNDYPHILLLLLFTYVLQYIYTIYIVFIYFTIGVNHIT